MIDSQIRTRPVSLSKLELIVVDLPQVESFQSAVGVRNSREALFVRWYDRDGNWGIGECSCRPDPFFSHEYLEGAVTVVERFVFPMIPEEGTYDDLLTICRRIRGWNFAKAAVLEAVHDLWRRQGLSDPVDAWPVARLEEVPVGISLGLYGSSTQLLTRIEQALSEGYRRVKLKIKPDLPSDYLASVRQTFPDAYLGCDANGSFSQANMDQLERLADLGLAMLEQPFLPDRLDLFAALKQRAPQLRLCADESVYHLGHLQAAVAMGAIDELNIKPGRVGGIPDALAMAEICKQHALPVWIGGMFETGIGRVANLRFAACFPDAKAHDLSPSSRYFCEDLVAEPVTMNRHGQVPTPQAPVTIVESQLDKFTTKRMEKRK